MNEHSAHDTGLIGLWFGNNYGAIMTTYALYRLLEKQEKKPLLLDQSPFTGYAPFCQPDNMSRAFMQRHGIHVTAPLSTDAELQALNDSLDTFVLGSDQVWRWSYSPKEGSFYFLDFVRGDKRKIAVASSIGVDKEERPAPLRSKARFYLQRFDAVSVREQSAVRLLEECYGVTPDWILDPVFLHGPALFESLTGEEAAPSRPYVLSYVLEPDAAIRRHIETIAAERGLEIINMVDGLGDFEQLRARFGGMGNIAQGVTPEQWVNYIRHCSFFVTDSFHGVCFAHLFHKDFVCVAPPMRGLTRFESLLGLTGLPERLLPPHCTAEQWQQATAPIDWGRVQSILDAEREKALCWLQQALTAPRQPDKVRMGRMTDELLYAGSGAKDRRYELEAQVQDKLACYRARTLPHRLRLGKILLHLLTYCPVPPLRRRALGKLHHLSRLLDYLKSEPR